MDNDGINQVLYKITGNDVFFFYTTYWGGKTKKDAQILKDISKEVAEGIYLREISLEKGKYVFASSRRSDLALALSMTHPISEPIYLFEIN